MNSRNAYRGRRRPSNATIDGKGPADEQYESSLLEDIEREFHYLRFLSAVIDDYKAHDAAPSTAGTFPNMNWRQSYFLTKVRDTPFEDGRAIRDTGNSLPTVES